MDRRGFMGTILALSAAPAVVRAESLMPIVPAIITEIGSASGMTGFPGPYFDSYWIGAATGKLILRRGEILFSGHKGMIRKLAKDGRYPDLRGEIALYNVYMKVEHLSDVRDSPFVSPYNI